MNSPLWKRNQTHRKAIIMTRVSNSAIKSIVLVHGGFVDGSCWEDVYKILKKRGYNVSIVQNPTISLADDVAVTRRVIAMHSGPVILVGHSYGGAVVTEAGNDPKRSEEHTSELQSQSNLVCRLLLDKYK